MRFEELFSDDLRKMVIVVTFMAILELVKMQEIVFRQEERFGPIMVHASTTAVRCGACANGLTVTFLLKGKIMSDNENDPVEQPSDAVAGEEELEQPKEEAPETLRILEALLFASEELLTTARLKAILPGNPDARAINGMVDQINRQLQKERHPFEVVEIGGGYQFKTIAYYHPWVRQIFQEKAAKRLSIQALECLSIISYRQPLSKAEIEAIRGVISDGAMKTLLEKRLITVTGRSEKPGRPLLYGTTQDFLKYFGLNKISRPPENRGVRGHGAPENRKHAA